MIKEIRAADIIAATDLLAKYAAECSIPLIGKINPQPAMYEALESAGVLKCFGAFDGDQIIGFVSVLTTVFPHYGTKNATGESIFALSGGQELIRAAETYAKEVGCETMLWSTPLGGRAEKYFLRKRGYRQTNSIHCKRLR